MQRNTITTLGQLRKGDRFCTPGKNEVWQVIDFISKEKVAVNQFNQAGKREHKYDVIKKAASPAKFLRHTVFEMGDRCLVEQLEEGDIFYEANDIVTEYNWRSIVMGKRVLAITYTHQIAFPFGTDVIFIRKSN